MVKKILIGLAVLVVLLVGGAAVAFWTIDPNVLKPYAERAVSSALGRPFRIAGDLEIERGWIIRIRAHDVHLGNAEWSDREDMATVQTVEASLDLWDLITAQRITIPELTLDRPVASLERNEQGEANWQFGGQEDQAAADQTSGPPSLPYVGRLTVRGAQVAYRDAQADQEFSASLASLTANSEGGPEQQAGWLMRANAQDLKVTNAGWSGQAGQLLSVNGVETSLDVQDFLNEGQFTIPEVTVDRPVVHLERDEQGRTNWQVGPEQQTEAAEAAAAAAPDDRAELPFVGKLTVRDAEVAYRDAQSGREIASTLSLTAESQGEGDRMKLQGEGQVNDLPVKLDGTFGSYRMLAGSDQPFPVQGTLTIGQSRVALDGTIADPASLEGVDLQTEIAAQDLSKAMEMVGVPAPEIPPFDLDGHLTYRNGEARLESLHGRVGDSDIAGSAAFAPGGERPKVSADLTSENLDLDDLSGLIGRAPDAGPGETASPEQEQQAQAEEDDPHVIPDPSLHADAWDAIDADVHFRGKRIRAQGVPLDDVDVHLFMEEGRLRIDPLKAGIAGATVDGHLAADGQRNPPAVEVDLSGSGLDLQRFLGEFDLQQYGSGRMSARVALKGEGDSLRSVLDTSQGQMAVIMEEGEITALLIEALGLDPAEILPVLFGGTEPGSGERLFEVRCMVVDLQVADGIARSQNIVLDTTDSVITAKGGVNLSTEAIQLDFEPHPKDTSIFASPAPVYIRGRFGEPSVMPDPTPAIIRGAAAVAVGVVLTPLASFLPFIDIGTAEDAPCAALISKTQDENALEPAEGEGQ
ncbi:AsmA family protein [Geminicoccus flavidas]|uniref:AsmA family protein n=1 Tax=Geminicoccus flavidas TaxID=2506407 RepID=UPI0013568A82|nr:AsmA family protein [Geminicoccus flavidas]